MFFNHSYSLLHQSPIFYILSMDSIKRKGESIIVKTYRSKNQPVAILRIALLNNSSKRCYNEQILHIFRKNVAKIYIPSFSFHATRGAWMVVEILPYNKKQLIIEDKIYLGILSVQRIV